MPFTRMAAVCALLGFRTSDLHEKKAEVISRVPGEPKYSVAAGRLGKLTFQGSERVKVQNLGVMVRCAEGLSQTGHVLRYAPWVINVGWEVFWVLRVSKERHETDSETRLCQRMSARF